MNKEDKELLLKDLSARLPYNVKVKVECGDIPYGPTVLSKLDIKRKVALFDFEVRIENCKPYLRPMSSMTEEEKKELLQISNFDSDVDDICYDSICCIERTSIDIADIANFISWLNAHHFDYRCLIEKGLAIAVTKENNPYHG